MNPKVLLVAMVSVACLLFGLGCASGESSKADASVSRPDIVIEAEVFVDVEDVGPEGVEDASVDATLGDVEEVDAEDLGLPNDGGPSDDVAPEDTPAPPTLYPAGRILSPINGHVAENLRQIFLDGVGLKDDVFMKVGASSTVMSANLTCFAGPKVELDDYEDLQPTIDFFLEGDAAGVSPFERKTEAAKVGMSAGWALSGSPSPLEQEFDALSPSYALVHYGTNDMGLGITYQSAIWKFGSNMLDLTDELVDLGVIPVLMAIAARGDKASADRWVDTYNAVIRGIAQSRQTPFLDLHFALDPLEGHGLAGDGIHLNTYKQNGSSRPCVFTDEGLGFGMNMRNLVSLISLDALRAVVIEEEPLVDDTFELKGAGTVDEPYQIVTLPFVDRRDTTVDGTSIFDTYFGCDAAQDESGPEVVYRLDLADTRRIRAMVFDRGSVDIDVHLLDETAATEGCLVRDHQIIEATLSPGTYHFSLDTYVGAGGSNAGEYLFVLLDCHPDDDDCDAVLLEGSP